MRYLLDCNILSEEVKQQPDRGVMNWVLQNGAASGISELTIGELYKGAYALPEGARRESVLAWIEELENSFGERMLPVNLQVLKCWGQLCGECLATGMRLQVIDSLLAATAMVYGLTVVTRNTADFPPQVLTLNPWKK